MIDPGPTKRRVRFVCRNARGRIDPKMIAEAFGATEVPRKDVARTRALVYPWFRSDVELTSNGEQKNLRTDD